MYYIGTLDKNQLKQKQKTPWWDSTLNTTFLIFSLPASMWMKWPTTNLLLKAIFIHLSLHIFMWMNLWLMTTPKTTFARFGGGGMSQKSCSTVYKNELKNEKSHTHTCTHTHVHTKPYWTMHIYRHIYIFKKCESPFCENQKNFNACYLQLQQQQNCHILSVPESIAKLPYPFRVRKYVSFLCQKVCMNKLTLKAQYA